MLLICGGPSDERNISLNSARSVYDHLEDEYDIEIIFIDKNLNYYLIDENFLYSNTTSDFDFKLKGEGNQISSEDFLKKVKEHDIILPIMHGIFAEDGQIQKILESQNASFIGSSSDVCEKIYNKKNADNFLKSNGFFTVPKLFIDNQEDVSKVKTFFETNNLNEAIIKPIEGGSSFGVKHAKSLNDAISIAYDMVSKNKKILVEKRCIGKEFTVIILENKYFKPVALIPTEIEVRDSDNIIFDTRRKYLSTNETHYYNPPRFSKETIDLIRSKAEDLFNLSGARDFLRIDGWLLDDGTLYFSDFNPISGMEQNSFIFQQGARICMTHKNILKYIINSCSLRNCINVKTKEKISNHVDGEKKRKINVIFGGITAERQVSLLSGSNVWLKLRKSSDLDVSPFLLFKRNNDDNFSVLKLTYYMVLNHTVEEILNQFKHHSDSFDDYANDIRNKLGLDSLKFENPECMSFDEFLIKTKKENAYVFLALHGGFGENGGIQEILENNDIKFNGSKKGTSALCMNKFKTGEIVDSMNLHNVRSAKKIMFKFNDLINNEDAWNEVHQLLGDKFIVKPNCDGSSSGVILINDENDFINYINLIKSKTNIIQEDEFLSQENVVNIGNTSEILFEEFIQTDRIEIKNNEIENDKKTGWVELTVGVLEKNGVYKSFNPSITIAQNRAILSLEEKFQGGTGVNLTPPPENIISKNQTKDIKHKLEKISEKFNMKDYCRVDIFYNTISDELIVIEINTLPALTPSTVLFQQATNHGMKPHSLIKDFVN